MEKNEMVIAGASVYNKKYFENPRYSGLPQGIKEELKAICVTYAEKLHCVFMISFEAGGDVVFQTAAEEADYNFDEIGAKLDADKLKREKKELIHALKMWYLLFQTEQGGKIMKHTEKDRERKQK